MILNYISFPVFIIGMAIGFLFVYILGPEIKEINIYPSPENVDKILFKDNADNCFYFDQEETQCPSDPSQISEIPIQA
jgi:hypothetical protein